MRSPSPPYRALLESPLGTIELLAGSSGLCGVHLHGERDVDRGEWDVDRGERDVDRGESAGGCLAEAARQLREYFAGDRRAFDLPLDPVGTPFQRAVWDVLRTIPFGTTISYGEQARRLGDRHKARAVGAANGRNPLAIVVPCHRVIGSDGSLVGFASGLDAKRWLLSHERRRSVVALPAPAVPGALASRPRLSTGA